MVLAGFQQSVNFLGGTGQQDFPEYTPLQKCHTTQDIFNPRTYISTQENSALQPNIFIINKKWGFEMTNYSTLVIECAGAHQHKSGLSPIVKKGYGRCQQKRIHYFHIILWNLKYPHRSFLAIDKDIVNLDGKFSRQKAAIRSQNTGLKATAAKRPHFAHGCGIYMLLMYPNDNRSEERRVGKECRSRWSPYH